MPRRALLFDLDHTLFDTERTEKRALRAVAAAVGVSLRPDRLASYQKINGHVWAEYRAGRLSSKAMRVLRFELWLKELDRATHDPWRIASLYLETFSAHGDLMRGAATAVRAAVRSGARLGIVTNGIDRVQRRRLRASGLHEHFRTVVTSERAGITKPDPRIMRIAIDRLRAQPAETLYIGDDPHVDGAAAHGAGVPFVWFNPHGREAPGTLDLKRTTVIRSHAELVALVC